MQTIEVQKQKEYIEKVNEINKEKSLKYYILTMGCQLNENDSEKLVGMVEQMGYSESKDLNDADLYLINTCCVRENAEEKVFGKLGELKKIKENREIIIAIGGCMMQEEHITEKIKNNPNITVIEKEVESLDGDDITVVATGPLTSESLSQAISQLTGGTELHFFDAAAPIVDFSTVNLDKAFFASRYNKGDADYTDTSGKNS